MADERFLPFDLSSAFNTSWDELNQLLDVRIDFYIDELSSDGKRYAKTLPSGERRLRGIPFLLGGESPADPVLLRLSPGKVEIGLDTGTRGIRHLIFAHSSYLSDRPYLEKRVRAECVATYTIVFDDGSVHSQRIKRERHIHEFHPMFGSTVTEAVNQIVPRSIPTAAESMAKGQMPLAGWGTSQTRVRYDMEGQYLLWLYAMENPYPDKRIHSLVLAPIEGQEVFISGITGSKLKEHPLRWEARKSLIVTLPDGFVPDISREVGNAAIDLGAVISMNPAKSYDDDGWEDPQRQKTPRTSTSRFVLDYTAHPDAILTIDADKPLRIPLRSPKKKEPHNIVFLPEHRKSVLLRVLDKQGYPVPVRIHVHDSAGQYLAPKDRPRHPNPFWFEDYSPDFPRDGHYSTYINGEAEYRMPFGTVFTEITKGFEIRPVRARYEISPQTETLEIRVEHVLPWQTNHWVTADTHVHFLSPPTALLEGEAEGVNVVNLLASQWGEFHSNVGDFDGKTTYGSEKAGGSGEYLVRVGTENRQHIMGHISLLGYEGRIILPLTTDGPTESAIGDPLEASLITWARQCLKQNGLVIVPHFPGPKSENAAAIVLGLVTGVEMASWRYEYAGISPYGLMDWYRYLNCGYHMPAVGGTDKMCAETAVGAMRTYVRIPEPVAFSYDSWKDAIRQGCTFVTTGPLLEFTAEGVGMGETLVLPGNGGLIGVEWRAASVTVPMTKVELILNGAVVDSMTIRSCEDISSRFSVQVKKSCWLALRILGGKEDGADKILAHSSAIMVMVGGQQCFNKTDAMSILEQIEDTTAYVRHIGTKADALTYTRILTELLTAHRTLHNRMHAQGVFHCHTAVDDHS